MSFDNRPRLTFNANVSESIGQVFGPNGTNKEFLAMDEVVDNSDGTWTAFYRYATEQDFIKEQERRKQERWGTRDGE